MSKTLGRTIVVNNKPGAATNIAADYVAKSRDVGNIMFTADFATLAANPALFAKLPYNAETDFAPVGPAGALPAAGGRAAERAGEQPQGVHGLGAGAKDGVSCASAGAGSPHHLALELFRERTGLKLQHVPYYGVAPAVQDLVGGQIRAA